MMAAFIYRVLSWIKGRQYHTMEHALNLQFPPIMHQVLEESFTSHFNEIFVIGDIHGCYDELVKLLEKAEVSNDRTLKLFVGDLVGKGPKSCEVVNLIRTSPSMFAVRGNHDEVALAEHNKFELGEKLDERNQWVQNLSKDNIDYLNNLPYTISIPSLKAIIVHAGLVPGLLLSQNCPTEMVTMRNLIEGDPIWHGGLKATKRDTTGVPWASLWPGPNHVYFGHDAKRMLQQYDFATGLDTGCVYGNKLTGIFINGPRKGTLVKVSAMKMHQKPGLRSAPVDP